MRDAGITILAVFTLLVAIVVVEVWAFDNGDYMVEADADGTFAYIEIKNLESDECLFKLYGNTSATVYTGNTHIDDIISIIVFKNEGFFGDYVDFDIEKKVNAYVIGNVSIILNVYDEPIGIVTDKEGLYGGVTVVGIWIGTYTLLRYIFDTIGHKYYSWKRARDFRKKQEAKEKKKKKTDPWENDQ